MALKLTINRSRLYDINGKEIQIGDRIRFYPSPVALSYKNNTWDGTVTFEDGMFTVSIQDAKQVQNPDGWNKKYDWVRSRSWAATVGYGEFGTWNCPRRPLTAIHDGFGHTTDHYEKFYKPLVDKIPFIMDGSHRRVLNVEILSKKKEVG